VKEIFHEMPLQMLEDGHEERLTSGHYGLVHLYEDDQVGPQYFQHGVQVLKSGRPFILDNSVFELEKAFDPVEFVTWILKLHKASHTDGDNFRYIIPDVLDDADRTIEQALDFISKYSKDLPGEPMVVVQGNTSSDLIECYQTFRREGLQRIAISFNCKGYESDLASKSSHLSYRYHLDSPHSHLTDWAIGRINFINLVENYEMSKSIVDPAPKLHLLGASLPQEFKAYRDMFIVESVDTSNPIVHGLKGQMYSREGLDDKLSIKLVDLFNMKEDEIDKHLAIIYYNVARFEGFVNG